MVGGGLGIETTNGDKIENLLVCIITNVEPFVRMIQPIIKGPTWTFSSTQLQ